MRRYRLYKMLQGLNIWEAEHKMCDANLTKLFQFPDNLCTVTGHKMFFRTAYHFGRVLRDTDRPYIGQLYFRRIPSHPVTMLFKNGDFMSIFCDRAGIEAIPIGIAGHYTERAPFATTADQQGNSGYRRRLAIRIVNLIVLTDKSSRLRS